MIKTQILHCDIMSYMFRKNETNERIYYDHKNKRPMVHTLIRVTAACIKRVFF